MRTLPRNPKSRGHGPLRSVATRAAAAVAGIMALVCVLLVVYLTRAERERLVTSKAMAAAMVADLFAAAIGPALDFQDPQATAEGLRALGSNGDVIDAAVCVTGGSAPLAALQVRPAGAVPRTCPRGSSLTISGEWIDVERVVKNPAGSAVGTAFLRVSLAHEGLALKAAERKILLATTTGALLVTLVLVAMIRRLVTTRLARLASAAHELGEGARPRVEESGDDEVASLGHAFNSMAGAIEDREARLQEANLKLQGVLDHTGQGIVAFGAGGRLTGVWSRLAEKLFGGRLAPGANVLDVVFPEASATRIERAAFREWLDVAFDAGAVPWEDAVELAPREAAVEGEGGVRALELAFRLLPDAASSPGALLLATDTTEQRTLERTVAAKDREHARKLAAMRRIASGGGPVFVGFVEIARERLARCRSLLGANGSTTVEALSEALAKVHSLRSEARTFELREFEELLASTERDLAAASEPGVSSPSRLGSIRAGLDAASDSLERALRLFVNESPIGAAVLEQVTVNRSDLDGLFQLARDRDDGLANLARKLAARPFGESTLALSEAFEGWSQQAQKMAHLEIRGREVPVPRELSRILGAVLAHLVRNAIAHGVELPTDRERAGKPHAGSVRVCCEAAPKGAIISVEDDGAGFHVAAIRGKADQLGLPQATAAEELAFSPGLSTASEVSSLAGYGVGLAAVRSELREAGYTVAVTATPGFGARIVLRPAAMDS